MDETSRTYGIRAIRPGQAQGPIVGGSLTLLVHHVLVGLCVGDPPSEHLATLIGAAILSSKEREVGKYLFVDHENVNIASVGPVDHSGLEVWVFVGPQQKSLPMETVKSLLELESKTRIIQVTRQGKNSLDFHISFELGALSQAKPKPEKVYVLSNDKGYDSVVAYARTKGLDVERITAWPRAQQRKTRSEGGDTAEHIVDALQKMDGKQRPRKLAKLRSYMVNRFKKHPEAATNGAIDRLLSSGRLVEEKGNVRYNL